MENGTGVYYQAMPAVGPDGKNVMKLIPVQKVNGQFVQTQVLNAKNDSHPQDSAQPIHTSPAPLQHNRLPTLQPATDGRFIVKTPLESNNTLFNSVKSQHRGAADSFKNAASQIHVPLVSPKVTPNPAQIPVPKVTKDVISSPQLPLTVKSPILPSGHYLQIPPNATVRTFPASGLPMSIKSPICNAGSVPSNPPQGFTTVVYVSRGNSLKLGQNQQVSSLTKSGEPPQTLAQASTPVSVKSVNMSSAPDSNAGQGVATLKKWVVQEGTGNIGPRLIPVPSTCVTSNILQAVKRMEGVKLVTGDKPTFSQTSQEKITPRADNTLVVCNGKVYIVAKKNSDVSKDLTSGAGSKISTQPTDAAQDSSVTQKQSPQKGEVLKKTNEIIDLCDDDDESSVGVGSAEMTLDKIGVENDEDSNVIFVSYIPPKSETETTKQVPEASSQNGGVNDMDGPDSGNMKKGDEGNSTSSPVTYHEDSRCQDATPVLEEANVGRAVSEQRDEACDRETDNTEKVSEDLAFQCGQGTEEVKETNMPLEAPALEQIPQQKSDSELRKIFGITSDLRIRLQKMNQAEQPNPAAERRAVNKRTLEGIRKLIHQSKIETKIKQLIQAQVPVTKKVDKSPPKDAKRRKLEQDGQRTCSAPSLSSVMKLSPSSTDTVKSDAKMECPLPKARKKVKVPQIHQSPRKGPSFAINVCNKQTTEHLHSSPSNQFVDTSSAEKQTESPTCPSSRKIPARQSKGNGRVCTVCPCGTKLGATNVSPKQEKTVPPVAVISPKGTSPLNQPDNKCDVLVKVAENTVSSPPESNVSETSGEMLHSNPSDINKDDKLLPQSAASLTSQHETILQPNSSSEAKVHSGISGVNGQGKTTEKSMADVPKFAVPMQTTTKQREHKARTSTGQLYVGESIPSEFYSPAPLDPEEIRRQERIRRLKDLLKEKEAALEKLRKSM